MKLILFIFLLIPLLSIAQESESQFDCDYAIEKITDSTFKIQVANFDSLNNSESCFLIWMNTAKAKPEGKLFVYDENKNRRRMAIYESGIRKGTHLVWYDTGELESETTWETDLYFNSKSYYKSGKIRNTAENGNRLNCIYKSYFENGQLERLSIISGEGDKEWYETGQIKLEINKIKNTYTEWHSNGKIKLTGKLLNGWFRTGKWTYYNEKGKRIRKLLYGKNCFSYYGDDKGYLKEKTY